MPKAIFATGIVFAIGIAAMVGLAAGAALAEDTLEGEFEGECVMGLALGKDIQTDCSVNTVYQGKTYCFGNETARTLFLKRPDDFLLLLVGATILQLPGWEGPNFKLRHHRPAPLSSPFFHFTVASTNMNLYIC